MKKLKLHFRVFTLFFVIFSVIGVLCVRGNEYSTFEGNYSIDNYEKYFTGSNKYDVKQDEFEVAGNDPNMFFDFTKLNSDGIHGAIIRLEDEINLSDVQVYFGYENKNFSEESSKIYKEEQGNTIEILSLDKFKYLRVDIDTDFTISEFETSKDVVIEKHVNWWNYLFVIMFFFAISILLSLSKCIDEAICRSYKIIISYIDKIKRNNLLALSTLLILIIDFVMAVIVEKLLSSGQPYINKPRLLVVFGIAAVISLSALYRKYILKYLHLYFFVVLMIIGSIHIIASPPSTGLSWDDEIHYGKTSYVSWGCDGKCSISDNKIQNYYGFLYGRDVLTFEGRTHWVNDMNQKYDSNGRGVFLVDDEKEHELSFIYVAYVPAAIGLSIARGLGLQFTYVFMIGKFVNLLCYGLLFTTAIYVIKNKGKLLIALVGLIPTSVFMACSYSYDWWLIGFLVLGYSIFFETLQSKEKFTVKKHLLITCILVLAILTKAVYFPLLLPMMFLKKDKYENSKLCRMITVIAILFLISTFITPILFGTKEGDSRGGEGVDSMGQVSFILTNPIEYTKILLRYLKSYLSLEKTRDYLTFLAYLGHTRYTEMCILILGVGAVLDNRKKLIKDKYYRITKYTLFFAAFASVVLVVTALYVSFTSVGHYTIEGCQPRYILPLVFPLLYYFGDIGLDVDNKVKNNFINIAILISSCIFLYATYSLIAIFY